MRTLVNCGPASRLLLHEIAHRSNPTTATLQRSVIISYFVAGPSSLHSPANSGELRRTRRSLGEGGHPRDLCLRGLRRSALIPATVPTSCHVAFHRSSHLSNRVTPTLTITTTAASTTMPAKTPVVSKVPSACEITWPRPRVEPRYSPTTAPTIANPRLVWRLEKIHVSALGISTCRTSGRP